MNKLAYWKLIRISSNLLIIIILFYLKKSNLILLLNLLQGYARRTKARDEWYRCITKSGQYGKKQQLLIKISGTLGRSIMTLIDTKHLLQRYPSVEWTDTVWEAMLSSFTDKCFEYISNNCMRLKDLVCAWNKTISDKAIEPVFLKRSFTVY